MYFHYWSSRVFTCIICLFVRLITVKCFYYFSTIISCIYEGSLQKNLVRKSAFLFSSFCFFSFFIVKRPVCIFFSHSVGCLTRKAVKVLS